MSVLPRSSVLSRLSSTFCMGGAILASVVSMSAAHADSYTFTPFDLTGVHDVNGGFDPTTFQLTGAPAGATYDQYTVTADWTAGASDPWSQEANFFLADGDVNTGTFAYASGAGAGNGGGPNGNPASFTWTGILNASYTVGNPLHFWAYQDSLGFDPNGTSNWSNISVTLSTLPSQPTPTATSIVLPSSNPGTLTASTIDWYTFNYSGSGAFSIATEDVSLSDPDTEIALYSNTGTLIAQNDDADPSHFNFMSYLGIGDGTLSSGDYYIAVGGFDSHFANGFNAFSSSGRTGDYLLNLSAIVPPVATPVTLPGINDVTTVTDTLADSEVSWYSFVYEGNILGIDTLGSNLSPDNDTVIGLYDALGGLVASNDDIDFFGGNLLSSLSFLPGDLTLGSTYYLAVGSFRTSFNPGFDAVSTGSNTGPFQVNFAVTVPETGTANLLLLGSLAGISGMATLARRRKKA